MSETNNTQERGLRKTRIGVVVSDKMDKTVTIQIKTRVRHPLYGKIMNQTSKLKVFRGIPRFPYQKTKVR